MQLQGVALHPKPLAWFKTVAILKPTQAKFTSYGLRTLTPAWALADLQANPLAWHPDVDDVEISPATQAELTSALPQLGGALDLARDR